MIASQFVIENETSDYMYIIDTGIDARSVTNDAGNVLSHLSTNFNLGNRRLIYRDSTGQIDEIVHDNGIFIRFKPGHIGINDL